MILIPVVKGFFCGVVIGDDFIYCKEPPGLPREDGVENYIIRNVVKDQERYCYEEQGSDDDIKDSWEFHILNIYKDHSKLS